MLDRSAILRLLRPPEQADNREHRVAAVMHTLIMTVLVYAVAIMPLTLMFPGLAPQPERLWAIDAVLLAMALPSLWLLRRGYAHLTSVFFCWSMWLMVTSLAVISGGMRSQSMVAYVVLAMVAAFCWQSRASIGFSVVTGLTGLGLLAADYQGLLPEASFPMRPAAGWLVLATCLVVTTIFVRFSVRRTDVVLEALEASRRQLEDRARQQTTVAELGRQALTEISLRDWLDQTVSVAAKTLGLPFVILLSGRAEDEKFSVLAGYGWPTDVRDMAWPNLPSSPAGMAIRSGENIMVEDLEHDPRFTMTEAQRRFGVKSRMSVVIEDANGPSGVLAAHSNDVRRYTDHEIEFLQAIGNLVALALRRDESMRALDDRDEQLRQSQKMEAVGQLAGGVAHDFNNLLTVIRGYSQIFLDQVSERDDLREMSIEVLRAADQATALTRQLLAFSRKEVVQPKVLDLNEIISEMERMLSRLLGETNALVLELDSGIAPIEIDPGHIEQVLLNLAINSRDAMPEGGSIFVATRPGHSVDSEDERSFVQLEVRDTGCGIDSETQSRIFEPFYTTKDAGKGTGLGLSTVYGIVTQAGGRIAVNSRLGLGTTMTIHLPASEGRLVATEPEAKAERRWSMSGETILLVEDDARIRELARIALESRGYRVLQASDGIEALKIAAGDDGTIDLLLTDVVMPRLGGPELAERLTAMRPKMKIIYMSGYLDRRSKPDVARSPILQKPFKLSELEHLTADVLEGRWPHRR